jgi:hypothetical protein
MEATQGKSDSKPVSYNNHFDKSRILIASFVFLIISQLLHIGGLTVSMDYYTHPNYYEVWSPLLISFGNINTGISFFYMSIIFGFIGAIIFVSIFAMLGSSIPGSAIKKGLTFGFVIFLIANVPGTLSMFLLLAIPLEIVILWTLESFLSYIIGGAVIGRIMMPPPQREQKRRRIDFGGNPNPPKPKKSGKPKSDKPKPSKPKDEKPGAAPDPDTSDEPQWMKQHDAGELK